MVNSKSLFSSSFQIVLSLLLWLPSQVLCVEKSEHRLELSKVELNNIASGSTGEIVVRFKVESGFHVQANPASQPNLIATELSLPTKDVSQGVKLAVPTYPRGVPFRLHSAKREIMTYESEFAIGIPVTIAKNVNLQKLKPIQAKLRYQACDAIRCYFPKTLSFEISFNPSP